MPLYEFQRLSDGEIVEELFEMGHAPSIGEVARVDGALCVRIPASSYQSRARRVVDPFVANSLPPWEGKKEGWHGRYDEDPKSPNYGQPMFTGRKEAEEFGKRSGGKWTFDGLPATAESRNRRSLKEVAKSEGLR